ncbi:MAG: hypothetical protein K2X27_08825 [Candidatus Obscuribacterales bacterium]|nr:hypothetical protein [Candidatus Obscuribacterales bacterium]
MDFQKSKLAFSCVILLGLFCFNGNSAWSAPGQNEPEEKTDKNNNSVQISNEQNKFGHKALKVRIQIHASPSLVFDAIKDNRAADPDVQYSKFTQITINQKLLEQKYVSIPILGSTTCTLMVEESLNKRIDYNLVKSDRLSEFEGSWVITKGSSDECTTLELSNHLKLKFPIPQKLIDSFSAPKMKERIKLVKELAESKQKIQIASTD